MAMLSCTTTWWVATITLFPREPHSAVEFLPQVLFGDPGSNLWIARALPWLPLLGWSKDAGFNIGQSDAWQWSFSEYGLSMVCPGLVLQPWRWLSDQPLNLRSY